MAYKRLMNLLDRWATHGVSQMLGTVVSLIAISLGISMFTNPMVFVNTPAFENVFTWASPFAWGTVYIVSAIAVLVSVYTNQKSAQAPVFMLGATFATHALLQIPASASGEVPSGIFMYMGVGWICFITQLVCGARKVPHEKSLVSY